MLSDESDLHQLCRLATLLWVQSNEAVARLRDDGVTGSEVKRALLDELVATLDKDPRVTRVQAPRELNTHYTYLRRYWPERTRTSAERLLTGADYMSVLLLPEPVLFTVRVPKKNQPTKHGFDDVPSDTYDVAWDGVTAWVIWAQSSPDIPKSGGHVVRDVLDDAARALGGGVYEQACSPGCTNIFLHTTLRLKHSMTCRRR